MLDVGAVAARSGPPVPPAEEAERLAPGDRRARRADRAADLRRHLLRRGRGGRRSTPAPSRSTTSAAARDPALFELAADRGCGLVLMHIEGPPREDRDPPRYDDPVDHLKGWFAERIEAALAAGVAEEQIALDPGLDFDLGVADGLEILRRLGELRELGRPLYVSLSRKDLLGAVLAGSWERAAARRASGSGRPAPRRRSRSQQRRRDPPPPRRERAAGDADRRGDRGCAARRGGAMPSGANVTGGAWEPALAAGPRGRPPGRRELGAGDDGEARRPAARPAPGAGRGARRAPGSSRSTPTRPRPTRPRASRDLILTSGTASGKSLSFNLPVLDGIAHDAEAARALPLPDQGAGPGPGPQARRAAPARTCARRSTTATRRARSGPRSAAARTWC